VLGSRDVTTTSPPRLAIVQHEDGCPLGRFDDWLRAEGAMVSVVRADRGEALPVVGSVDGLVVLGGSMSATDDERSPWLPAVRSLLGEAVAARLPTLGVCLGHQLLAVACGGEVAPNPAGKQMGVLPIGLLPAAGEDPLLGPLAATGPAVSVHWNDDVVARLPRGAVLLATSPDGVPQAVRVGPAAWGVQFHPEVDVAIVRAWAEHDPGPGAGAQAAALAEVARSGRETTAAGRVLATRFAAIAGVRATSRSRSR
jgi:GMP synthase (glutamine-hydrolysing)